MIVDLKWISESMEYTEKVSVDPLALDQVQEFSDASRIDGIAAGTTNKRSGLPGKIRHDYRRRVSGGIIG